MAREESMLVNKEQSDLSNNKLSSINTLFETPPTISKKIICPLEWNLLPEGVDTFYKGLMNMEQETLGCTLESFRAVFLTPETARPVKWLGKPGELACLLGTLNAKNVISTLGKYWPTITEFFYYSQGAKFSHSSLSVQYSRNQSCREFDDSVQKLINQLKDDWKQKLTGVNQG